MALVILDDRGADNCPVFNCLTRGLHGLSAVGNQIICWNLSFCGFQRLLGLQQSVTGLDGCRLFLVRCRELLDGFVFVSLETEDNRLQIVKLFLELPDRLSHTLNAGRLPLDNFTKIGPATGDLHDPCLSLGNRHFTELCPSLCKTFVVPLSVHLLCDDFLLVSNRLFVGRGQDCGVARSGQVNAINRFCAGCRKGAGSLALPFERPSFFLDRLLDRVGQSERVIRLCDLLRNNTLELFGRSEQFGIGRSVCIDLGKLDQRTDTFRVGRCWAVDPRVNQIGDRQLSIDRTALKLARAGCSLPDRDRDAATLNRSAGSAIRRLEPSIITTAGDGIHSTDRRGLAQTMLSLNDDDSTVRENWKLQFCDRPHIADLDPLFRCSRHEHPLESTLPEQPQFRARPRCRFAPYRPEHPRERHGFDHNQQGSPH